MMDIINPWGALRRAQRLIAELLADVENWYVAHERVAKRLEAAEALIAKAHFRNPETGRIGPVGKTFQ